MNHVFTRNIGLETIKLEFVANESYPDQQPMPALLSSAFAADYLEWMLGVVPFIAFSALASVVLGQHDGLLHFLVDDNPPVSFLDAIALDVAVWLPSACAAFAVSHLVSRRFKFNPEHPPLSFVFVEMARCVGGMAVAAAWEMALLHSGGPLVDSKPEQIDALERRLNALVSSLPPPPPVSPPSAPPKLLSVICDTVNFGVKMTDGADEEDDAMRFRG